MSTMVSVPTPFPRRSGGTECALWAVGEDGRCRGERPGRQSCTAWTASSSMSPCNKHANKSMTGCKCNTDGNSYTPALSFQWFHEMLQHTYIYIYISTQTNLWLTVNVTLTVTHNHTHFDASMSHCIHVASDNSLYPSHTSTLIWLLLPATATITHKCIIHKYWKFDMNTTCKHTFKHTCVHAYTHTLSHTHAHVHTHTHTHTHTYLWIMAGVRSTSGFSTVKVKFFPFFSKYPVSFLFMITTCRTFNTHNMVFTIHTFC